MNIKFLDTEYNEAGLKDLTIEDLLKLRNLVATNLGVQAIKSFKDHETAVGQTWKALLRFDEVSKEETSEAGPKEPKAPKAAKEPKAPKPPKEPKVRELAKPAEAGYVKRPTKKMFSIVNIVKQHTGAEPRAHRWPNYRDGMMVIDAIEGVGTLPWDIYTWASLGLMTVTEPTDEEYAERRAKWYADKGMVDPDLNKITKKAEAEKAKEERAAAAAKKKEEAAAAKAAKEAALAEAKAAKEAALAEAKAAKEASAAEAKAKLEAAQAAAPAQAAAE